MELSEIRLNEKEIEWIKEFFRVKFNVTKVTKRVYGGTPVSCRVKGHKKFKKLEPILTDIYKRGFHKMESQGISGVDFYLGDLMRRIEEDKRNEEIIKKALKSKRAFAQLEKTIRESSR